jgi:hypothetical protein
VLLAALLLLPGHAVRLAVRLAVALVALTVRLTVALAVALAAERMRFGHLYLGSRFLLDGGWGSKSLTAAPGVKG